jgi:hypothetical protein
MDFISYAGLGRTSAKGLLANRGLADFLPRGRRDGFAQALKVIPFIVNNLPDIQSLLMVRNGYLVFENYYGLGMPDRQDTIHSVTKSVTSALVGIARDKGLLTGAINEFRVRVDQCRINGDKAKFFGEIETNMGRIPWRCRT